MGRGWWCWIIPLSDGSFSAGVTWDRRLFTLPEGPSLAARLQAHLLNHPVQHQLTVFIHVIWIFSLINF
jgi:hypothetical protein